MMKPASVLVATLLTTLAGAAAIGCTGPETRSGPIPAAPAWQDTGTPAATIATEREVRYYRDETGTLWDDRGRKVEGAS